MQCLTWMAPILPGKLAEWEAFDEEMKARQPEHQASRRRMGLHREVASLLQTSQGDFVCLFHEADDLGKAFQVLAESDDPYDTWFCHKLEELHGITSEMMTAGDPPAILKFDWQG